MTQYQRFELSRIDGEIAELEKKMAVKHEQRRELVNRMGLNKCDHKSKTCAKSSCSHDDWGNELAWQHTEIKP